MPATFVSAAISPDEIRKFVHDFTELEVSRGSMMMISPAQDITDRITMRITVAALTETWGGLLIASFQDGMLRQWGWGELFTQSTH